ncbi:MAG: tetratricopeptide repeat protein [Candidatus Eisenbacteria bacterium]|nr:tetratricopeptide repeat protein [Candidatus Eisenbacteria bacterium]
MRDATRSSTRPVARTTRHDRPTRPSVGGARVAVASAKPHAQVFRIGERVAGRFRIVRFIAGGGMGEVYEALDPELAERVALKTIRPEIVRDASAIARLKRELQLARRVTHRSICRLHDFGTHRRRGREIPFVTMELLPGERLDQRISRLARLAYDEAERLTRGIAQALAAAHAASVVHCDLKPGNVILVEGARGERVVVTDFGIAAAVGSAESARWGTPAYMAPEQRRGERAGAAADLYALGVLLHEMLFGLPFVEQGHDRLEARLGELPARLASVLRRTLVSDPRERSISAEEIVDLLAPLTASRPRVAPAMPSGANDRGWWNAWTHLRSQPQDEEAARTLQEGLELLRLRRPTEALERFESGIARDPEFALLHCAKSDAWTALGYERRALEAAREGFLRSGSLPRREQIEVEARLRRLNSEWDTAIQLTQALWIFDPSEPDLGIGLATMQLDAGRHADALATISELRARAEAGPPDPRLDLLEAEQAWCVSDAPRQLALAKRVVQAVGPGATGPIPARAHFLSATAHFLLGSFGDSETHFGAALELFAGDPRGVTHTLMSLGLLFRTRGKRARAAELYEQAHQVARAHGQRRDTASAVTSLAALQMIAGNTTEAARFCEEALREHREAGSVRGMVSSLTMKGIVQSTLGQFQEARATYREALGAALRAGDTIWAITVLQNLANACATWGRFAEAYRRSQEAERLARLISNPVQIAHARCFAAFSLIAWGRLIEAGEGLEQAKQTFERVGDRVRLASSSMTAGQLALYRGQLEVARAIQERALALSHELSQPQFVGWATAHLGEVALWEGNLAAAREHTLAAIRIREETNDEWALLHSFHALAQIDLAEGRFDDAVTNAGRTIERALRYGRPNEEALGRALEARAHLAAGRPAPARRSAARARRCSSGTESLFVRFWVDYTGASIALSAGEIAIARPLVERMTAWLEHSKADLYHPHVARLAEQLR